MHRRLPIGTCAGALALCLVAIASVPAQAAPVAGLSAIPGRSAEVSSMVDKAGWRRWRWHRNWWWRWRRW
jgi:hypothetical protein